MKKQLCSFTYNMMNKVSQNFELGIIWWPWYTHQIWLYLKLINIFFSRNSPVSGFMILTFVDSSHNSMAIFLWSLVSSLSQCIPQFCPWSPVFLTLAAIKQKLFLSPNYPWKSPKKLSYRRPMSHILIILNYLILQHWNSNYYGAPDEVVACSWAMLHEK